MNTRMDIKQPISSAVLLREERLTKPLELGCESIDKLLRGGLPSGRGIIELVGEASAGKTQFALQYCLQSRIRHFQEKQREDNNLSIESSASSIFLNTKGPFPIKRLEQLSEFYSRKCSNCENSEISVSSREFQDSVFVRQIGSIALLREVLSRNIPRLLKTHDINLLVLDSIAALIRGEESSDLIVRSKILFEISSLMKELSHKYNMVVLVLNEVSDVMQSQYDSIALPTSFDSCHVMSSNRIVRPALGPSWTCNLFMRLFLTRKGRGRNPGNETEKRGLVVVLSSHIPRGACEFSIQEHGII